MPQKSGHGVDEVVRGNAKGPPERALDWTTRDV